MPNDWPAEYTAIEPPGSANALSIESRTLAQVDTEVAGLLTV
jgi:hypothetical protein